MPKDNTFWMFISGSFGVFDSGTSLSTLILEHSSKLTQVTLNKLSWPLDAGDLSTRILHGYSNANTSPVITSLCNVWHSTCDPTRNIRSVNWSGHNDISAATDAVAGEVLLEFNVTSMARIQNFVGSLRLPMKQINFF